MDHLPPSDSRRLVRFNGAIENPGQTQSGMNSHRKGEQRSQSKASPWNKPTHTANFGVQVYPDDKELLIHKFGWKAKEFSTKMCQTELPFSINERSEHLKEYERYFGPKMVKKRGGLSKESSIPIKDPLP